MMTEDYAYGMWIVAAFNVGLFLFFILSFLTPKERIEWRNMGIVAAFLVALFSEMYGFPLTIYILTGWLGDSYPALQPFSHKFGHLWVVIFGESNFAWALVMGLSLLFLGSGYLLLSKGWRLVHGSADELVTTGVYQFVRHPQYTGLFLMIAGFLIQWPTMVTVLMTPILIAAYVLLAKKEERAMTEHFRNNYLAYAAATPRFFPPIKQWGSFMGASGAVEKQRKGEV